MLLAPIFGGIMYVLVAFEAFPSGPSLIKIGQLMST